MIVLVSLQERSRCAVHKRCAIYSCCMASTRSGKLAVLSSQPRRIPKCIVLVESCCRCIIFSRVARYRLAHLSVCVCVCRSVQKVYCGKTANWIRMPFGMVSGVGGEMSVLDGGGYRRREGVVLGLNLGASHCN